MVSFRPGHGPEETEEKQMDLLSAAVSFLVAHGNNATDEVCSGRACPSVLLPAPPCFLFVQVSSRLAHSRRWLKGFGLRSLPFLTFVEHGVFCSEEGASGETQGVMTCLLEHAAGGGQIASTGPRVIFSELA